MESTRPVFSPETTEAIRNVLEREDQQRTVARCLDQPSITISDDGKTRIITCETMYVGRGARFVPPEGLPNFTLFCKTFVCFGALKFDKFRVEADTIILAGVHLAEADTIDLVAKKTLMLINCDSSSWKEHTTFDPEPTRVTHTVTRTDYLKILTATRKFAEYLFPDKTEFSPVEAAIDYLRNVCSNPPTPQAAPSESPGVELQDLGQFSAPTREAAEAHFATISGYGTPLPGVDTSAVAHLGPCTGAAKRDLASYYVEWISDRGITVEDQRAPVSDGKKTHHYTSSVYGIRVSRETTVVEPTAKEAESKS